MSESASIFKGVLRGKIIELEQAPGLQDGLAVRVLLQPLEADSPPLTPGEGLRRSAGAWADDAAELDAYLAWNRQQRKVGRGEISE